MIVYFEGIDGVGKSTQIALLKEQFGDAIITCEPGGTELGKSLRQMIFRGKICSKAELFLFLADRAEHYASVLAPHKDSLVLSDRGFVSGIAYGADSFEIDELVYLNKFALNDDFQGKFVFFKADEKLIHERLMKRATSDSIEKRGIEYLLRVQNYMELVLKDLGLTYLEIDANDEISAINAKIIDFIKDEK